MTDMLNSKVSVVLPNYNHGRYISRALDAIVSQSCQPFEIIVIDDGSTDDSVAVIESFAERHGNIRLFKNGTNRGIYYSLEKALEIASGEYIAPAASDDVMLPGYFEKQMRLLERYPDAGLSSGLSLKMNEEGAITGSIPTAVVSARPAYLPPAEVRRLLEKYGSWINGNTTIYRRACMDEFGGFRKELLSYTDGFLQLIIALKYGACFVPEPLCIWRELQTGISLETAADVDKTRTVIGNTKRLMRSESMAEYFSDTFMERWEKRRLFWIGDALARRMRRHHTEIFREIDKLYPAVTPADRAVRAACSGLNALESLLIFAYFTLKNLHGAFFSVFLNRLVHEAKSRLRGKDEIGSKA